MIIININIIQNVESHEESNLKSVLTGDLTAVSPTEMLRTKNQYSSQHTILLVTTAISTQVVP